MEMTKKALVQLCKEHELYRTPELNDKLYCNFKGFTCITPALAAYTHLKALFLEGNALESLREMPRLEELRCLFVQQNLLSDLSGLEVLPLLDTLNISNNRIEKLSNLSKATKLTTLIATDNQMQSKADIEHLIQCPSLLTVDLQNNKLDDVAILDVLEALPALRCLYLKGNDVVGKIRNYRRVVVSRLKSLTYLDDRPVFDAERRMTDAWARGGVEAERLERERIKEEEREQDRRNFEYLQNIRREGWRKRREALGLPPGDTDPFFDQFSSTSPSEATDEPEELVAAQEMLSTAEEWPSFTAEDDGVIYLDSVRENEKALEAKSRDSQKTTAGHHVSIVQRDEKPLESS